MTCQIAKTRGAVFAVWGSPEAADMDRVLTAVTEASEQAGGPIVYVTRVPSGAPPPDGAAKQRLKAVLPGVLSACSSYHVVLEGEGFAAAFKRGVLTSLLQPFWRKRMFFVHATCADIRSKLLPEEAPAVESVLATARVRGLLSGPAPGLRTVTFASLP